MLNEEIIKRIYNSIEDDYSRKVFKDRLLFSLTGEESILDEIRKDCKGVILADERLKALCDELYRSKERFYIFGCGLYARHFFELMPDLKPKGFIDSNAGSTVGKFLGFPVYNVESFCRQYEGEKVLISSKPNYFEMLNELEKTGVDKGGIINGGVLWDIIEGRQYFDLPELPHVTDEAFVDAGPLDGLSCVAFHDWCGDNNAMCYCFEPDEGNRKKTAANLKAYGSDNYELFEAGLWDSRETLLFDARGMGESRVIEDGKNGKLTKETDGIIEIPVVKMDEVLSGKRVTFIKMDIEGSELRALKGAEDIIRKQKPKLAICVYHKPEDIWEIPGFIQSLRNDYKFYFRHYCYWGTGETVMYAI